MSERYARVYENNRGIRWWSSMDEDDAESDLVHRLKFVSMEDVQIGDLFRLEILSDQLYRLYGPPMQLIQPSYLRMRNLDDRVVYPIAKFPIESVLNEQVFGFLCPRNVSVYVEMT